MTQGSNSRSRTTRADERLSALEEGYRNLGREVGGLREDLHSLAVEIRRELSSRARVQWSPMIASIALALTIMGGFAQGPLRDIKRNEDALARIQDNRFTWQDGSHLKKAVERIQSNVDSLAEEDFDRNEAERMEDKLTNKIEQVSRRLDEYLTGIRVRGSQQN